MSIVSYFSERNWARTGLISSVGAAAGRSGAWLSRQIDLRAGETIAGRILAMVDRYPGLFDSGLECARYLRIPITWIQSRALHYISEPTYSNFIAPLVEESIFRLGLQGSVAYALTSVGLPAVAAEGIAISCASYLFAQAHDMDVGSLHFRVSLFNGIIYGFLHSHYGFSEAALSHMIYNISIDYF